MTIQIATPFSELFKDKSIREAIIHHSDVVELRKLEQVGQIDYPSIFHSDMSLIALWSDRDRSMLSAMAHSRSLEVISFHIASRYGQNVLRDGAFHGIGRLYSDEEMKDHAQSNVAFLRKTFGDEYPILVENNNDLGTDAYQTITDGDFITSIVEDNDIHFLWDIAHSEITAINRHIDHEDYLLTLPLERGIQVHLSGYGMKDGFAYDAHEVITDTEWTYFTQQIPRLPELKFATIEYYKDSNILQKQLRKLRQIIGLS